MIHASFGALEAQILKELRAGSDPLQTFERARSAGKITPNQAVRVWQYAQGGSSARRQKGAYYTDLHVAERVARSAVRAHAELPERMLEPSCGGGALIEAILHEGRRAWSCTPHDIATRIEARDLDPVGLALAQWRIAHAFEERTADAIQWTLGDTLEHTPNAPYDWIFGNPPFGNAIERATRRSGAERARYARAFPLSSRGAFDKCALFIEWAMHHVAQGGTITYILPRSWLAQPASSKLRQHLAQKMQVLRIEHLCGDAFFDASVSTIAVTLKNAPPSVHQDPLVIADGDAVHVLNDAKALLQQGNWGAALHAFAPTITLVAPALVGIHTVAEFSAGATTEEAYVWAEHVVDKADLARGDLPHTTHASKAGEMQQAQVPAIEANKDSAQQTELRALLIAGRIDPFTHTWGVQTTRYLGEDYLRPMLPFAVLSKRRQALHDRPRALLPTLSTALEATVDLDAQFIGAVSAICAWPSSLTSYSDEEALDATLLLAAMLNSAWCRLQYACLFSALALKGGNTQVSKNKLSQLQIPQEWADLLRKPAHGKVLESREKVQLPVHPLTKKLPTLEQFYALCADAQHLAATHTPARLQKTLFARLRDDPHASLHCGALDLLLLSLASAFLARVESAGTVS